MSQQSSTKVSASPSLNRRTYLKTAAGAVLGASLAGRSAAQTGSIPPTALYEVTMQGATKYGPFARTAQLSLFPPFDPSGVTFNNGVNARDVGLFSGNPPGAPEAGAIWFGTNTAVHQAVGIDTTPAPEIAALDVAFVEADEAAGVLVVTIDGNFFGLPAARSSLLNCVTPTDGILAPIYQLIQGAMQLQFGDGGNAVSGVVDFVGNGYIEPGTTPYQATLSGVRIA